MAVAKRMLYERRGDMTSAVIVDWRLGSGDRRSCPATGFDSTSPQPPIPYPGQLTDRTRVPERTKP